MVSYVMEGTRGGRSLVALLVALAVATVGVSLVVMSTTAKPAQAVSCAASSYRPSLGYGDSIHVITVGGTGEIYCNSAVKKVAVLVQLQRQNANGGWTVIQGVSKNTYGHRGAAAWPEVVCGDGKNSRYAYYRIATKGYTIAGPYNYKANYSAYSSKQWLKCSGTGVEGS